MSRSERGAQLDIGRMVWLDARLTASSTLPSSCRCSACERPRIVGCVCTRLHNDLRNPSCRRSSRWAAAKLRC